MTPTFSIIIPHKNNSNKLRRLLSSIPNSNDVEAIVVDDCSSAEEAENAATICREFNNIITIFLREPHTAGGARNVGIRSARGRWLIFADSDDHFSSEIEQIMIDYGGSKIIENDIIYFDVTSKDSSGGASYRHEDFSNFIQRHLKGIAPKIEIRYRHTPPWGKIISRKLITDRGITFDEVPASNDVMFSLRSGHYARNIGVDNRILYVVTQSKGSITNTISERNLQSKFDVALTANSFLKEVGAAEYQHSILYFLYRAATIRPALALHFITKSIVNNNNIFIGFRKIIHFRSTIKKRESR